MDSITSEARQQNFHQEPKVDVEVEDENEEEKKEMGLSFSALALAPKIAFPCACVPLSTNLAWSRQIFIEAGMHFYSILDIRL